MKTSPRSPVPIRESDPPHPCDSWYWHIRSSEWIKYSPCGNMPGDDTPRSQPKTGKDWLSINYTHWSPGSFPKPEHPPGVVPPVAPTTIKIDRDIEKWDGKVELSSVDASLACDIQKMAMSYYPPERHCWSGYQLLLAARLGIAKGRELQKSESITADVLMIEECRRNREKIRELEEVVSGYVSREKFPVQAHSKQMALLQERLTAKQEYVQQLIQDRESKQRSVVATQRENYDLRTTIAALKIERDSLQNMLRAVELALKGITF